MKDTAIDLTPDMAARLAVGHDTNLKPVKNWDFSTLVAAGWSSLDPNFPDSPCTAVYATTPRSRGALLTRGFA